MGGSAGSGGGVYVDGSGAFAMSGGTISGNTASGTMALGGGVNFSGSSFTMSHAASVDTGNVVVFGYYSSSKVITLSGALIANPAANIEVYPGPGTPVLVGDITVDDNYKKFWLNGASNAAGDKIGADGTIQ
jgi:hypothetical protein